eukprot:CAMPEP_0116564074 /NCGR_PEP_ID=MMETSP0397-20121206/13104_1 /TAXON_ID=216820 /ORGANISM="Cyclophora tenuis, Strain ECT3854" /LENGTH=111 /DNA_ID=CAMNT_0004090623 /DNA_START=42 /DNA_END=374 /DNA_ORIENTATION=+
MMYCFLVLLFALIAVSSAFAPPPPPSKAWGTTIITKKVETRQFMFSAGEDEEGEAPKALEQDNGEDTPLVEPEKPVMKMVAKDMNTGEMKQLNFVDPDMAANTNPLTMNWW